MRRMLVVIATCLALGACSSAPDELVVRHRRPKSAGDARNEYFVRVLGLALQKTEATDGPFRLVESTVAVAGDRSLEAVAAGILDVDWRLTSKEREEQFLPVRFPLLKGLSGYRVLLIREGDQGRFDEVRTLEDLRKLKAGQGTGWLDVDILRANDLPVVEVEGYDTLFFLLAQGRFDYFPRNVSEIVEEARAHRDRGLAVERGLLLHYPVAEYFFVSPQKAALADRLARGLSLALRDGSFDELFRGFPSHKLVLEKVGEHGRRILELRNPLLPAATPLQRSELWLAAPGGTP